jgi:hypothetical protein
MNDEDEVEGTAGVEDDFEGTTRIRILTGWVGFVDDEKNGDVSIALCSAT